jgi:hypothetical protein
MVLIQIIWQFQLLQCFVAKLHLLIYASAILIFVHLEMDLGGGPAPSSQTVGSLLRTSAGKAGQKNYMLGYVYFAESTL